MSIQFKGTDALIGALKEKATMDDVKNVVRMNTAELQKKAMRAAPVDTGTLKRYIMISTHDNGLSGRVKPLVRYAGCYHIARSVINYVLESVKIGGNLIVKPFFRVWNMV